MKLNIELPPEIEPSETIFHSDQTIAPMPAVAVTSALSKAQANRLASKQKKFQPLFDVMVKAQTSRNGVRINCADKAQATNTRFRLYSARRFFREQGIHSLDSLIITIEDTSVLIKREAQLLVEDLD